MSSIDEKYQKKYLKYKKKFLSLREKNLEELQQNGGSGKWESLKSAAKSAAKKGASIASSVASNPAVREAALNAATTAATIAAQDPAIQAKLAQAQQAYANSPSAQLAAQIALSHPTVQSAMSHPATQQAMNIAKTSASGVKTPDSIWNTLTLDQKQKLINLLPTI